MPTSQVRASVTVQVSQKMVGISAADFQSSPVLRSAFTSSVCWSLRPFPDCSNINITRIVDASFSFKQQQKKAARVSSSRSLQGGITYLTQITYTLLFYDNFVDGGSNNPGEEKRRAISAAVLQGSFAATFFERVASMATNDPATLAIVQQVQFTEPSVGLPSFSTFLPKASDAPTLDPTSSPTVGLGLNLQPRQLAAAFIIILGVVGAACAPSLGWYFWRRHIRAARRVKDQDAANALMQKMRAAAAVSPEPAGLSPEQLRFGDEDDDDDDDKDDDEEEGRIVALPTIQKEEEKSEFPNLGGTSESRLPVSTVLTMPPHPRRPVRGIDAMSGSSSDEDDDDEVATIRRPRPPRKETVTSEPSASGDVGLRIREKDSDSDSDDGMRLDLIRLISRR